MITPNKKTKRKNILTALGIIAFMIFLFFFTLYNTGVFESDMIQKKNLTPLILAGIFVLMLGLSYAAVPLYLSLIHI